MESSLLLSLPVVATPRVTDHGRQRLIPDIVLDGGRATSP